MVCGVGPEKCPYEVCVEWKDVYVCMCICNELNNVYDVCIIMCVCTEGTKVDDL